MLRTNTCGELSKKDIGQEVTLSGWVHRRRDHGGVIFIDLRDRWGLTQIKFDPEINKKTYVEAEKLRSEWVLQATGKVVARPVDMVNKKLKTGEVEVEVTKLNIFSAAITPPFELEEEKQIEVREELRMKYRYVDMRRSEVKDILMKRHEFISFIRDYLNKKDFVEVETPALSKSTPEGARDFLVPSRLQPGQFYALPQSPQQYKQLLMIGGLDRYYQIARCFRDEDTRGHRQAEFTQLDLEMSFVTQDDVLNLTEDLFTKVIEKIFPEKKIMKKPWPRLKYDDVMLKYGIDKPDIRFDLEIKDVTGLVENCGFQIFADAIKSGGVVRAICATGAAKFTRKEIDELTEHARSYGAKGLAYIVVKKHTPASKAGDPSREGNYELQSPIVKFLGDELSQKIVKAMQAKPGDIIFFGADKEAIVCETLAHLRLKLGEKLGMIDNNILALAFVVDFYLFEREKVDGRYVPEHHMFTLPRVDDIPLLDKDPLKARSYQHDMVGNGVEIGGGSIRIHDAKLQEKIFNLIGFNDAKKKEFAHFLRAFQFGVPPHGGIAPGLDRILMLLMDQPSIRDVMAFPKTGDGRDLTMEAPSVVTEEQLKDLHIKLRKVKE